MKQFHHFGVIGLIHDNTVIDMGAKAGDDMTPDIEVETKDVHQA